MRNARYIKTVVLLLLSLQCVTAFAQWTSNGPYGGGIRSITVADTNLIVCSSGIFINTTSAATHWTASNRGLTSGYVTATIVAGSRILAATGDSGIYISDNRGHNWASSNIGINDLEISALIVSGTNIFAGTVSGHLFMSTDSGNTWTVRANTGIKTGITGLASDGVNLYATTSANGVLKSTTNGDTWTAFNKGLSTISFGIYTPTVLGSDIYVSRDGYVYKSPLSAISWTPIVTGLVANYISCIYLDGTNLYAGTDNGLFKTQVNANIWYKMRAGLPTDVVNSVAVYAGKLFVGTGDNDIYVSDQTNLNFSQSKDGFNAVNTYCVATLDTQVVVGATGKGVYRSLDLAANYTGSNKGLDDSNSVITMQFAGNILFAGTLNKGVFMSKDTGKTWTAVNTGLTVPGVRVTAILGTANDIYIGTEDGKVFHSQLASISWTAMSTGLPTGLNAYRITSIVLDGNTPYMSTQGGGVYFYSGSSWYGFNGGLSNKNINGITIYGGNVYAATAGTGVCVSSLRQASWRTFNANLPSLNITAISSADSYVVAGYKGGVMFTTDNAGYWLPSADQRDIPSFSDVISFAFTARRIFIATPGNSFYSLAKTDVPPVSSIAALNLYGIADDNGGIGDVTISPNPNSGSFELSIILPANNTLKTVTVYDLAGRLIEKLRVIPQQKLSTSYPKGSYFIQAITTRGAITQKVLIQ